MLHSSLPTTSPDLLMNLMWMNIVEVASLTFLAERAFKRSVLAREIGIIIINCSDTMRPGNLQQNDGDFL